MRYIEVQGYQLELSINSVIYVQDEYGIDITKTNESLSLKDLRAIIHGMMLKHHPETSVLDAGELMTDEIQEKGAESLFKAVEQVIRQFEGDKTSNKKGKK